MRHDHDGAPGRRAPAQGSGDDVGVGIVEVAGRLVGQQLFLFSARLLAGALIFAGLLGAVAALYATLRVVRLSPAEAIRRGA